MVAAARACPDARLLPGRYGRNRRSAPAHADERLFDDTSAEVSATTAFEAGKLPAGGDQQDGLPATFTGLTKQWRAETPNAGVPRAICQYATNLVAHPAMTSRHVVGESTLRLADV
jgi:hypothetical protein